MKKKFQYFGFVLMSVLFLAAGLFGFNESKAEAVADLSGIYFIRSKNSNLVMDIYNGGRDNGNRIIQWPFHGGLNQQWNIKGTGDGYYTITSVLNPKYSMDVFGGGIGIGTNVIQYSSLPTQLNQKWKLQDNGDGSFSFKSQLSIVNNRDYVLDVYGGGMTAGVNVIQWQSHGGANQRWYLQPVNPITVSFNPNGGSNVSPMMLGKSGLISAPAIPSKAASIFGGWFKDATLTLPWDFSSDLVDGNMTLYAKWTPAIPYTFTFVSNGGSAVENLTQYGTLLATKPSDPVYAGFRLVGWFKDMELTDDWNFTQDVVQGNQTLYAKWEDVELIPNGVYTIASSSRGVMAVPENNPRNGIGIAFGAAKLDNNDLFEIVNLPDRRIQIIPLNSDKPLSIVSTTGDSVVQWYEAGGVEQTWNVISDGSGYRFINARYSTAMDASSSNLVQNINDGRQSQLFTVNRISNTPNNDVNELGLAGKIIWLDPGHGRGYLNASGGPAFDPGTTAGGIYEYVTNAQYALELRDRLQAAGATVYMTRTNTTQDAAPFVGLINRYELRERAWRANTERADVLLSFHSNYNAYSTSQGAMTFYYGENPSTDLHAWDSYYDGVPDIHYTTVDNRISKSIKLASYVQTQIGVISGFENDGIKGEDYAVIRETSMPAILMELGFVSNPRDNALRTTPSERTKTIDAIYNGLVNYFNDPTCIN